MMHLSEEIIDLERTQNVDRDAVLLAAAYVKAARELAELNIRELEERISGHNAGISRIENGKAGRRGPTLATLLRISRACGLQLTLKLE